MSPRLAGEIAFELNQIAQLLAEARAAIDTSKEEAPLGTTKWALGAILHAFYNGAENVFKRIAVVYDGKPEKSDQWHIDLLSRMSKPTSNRPAVISTELCTELKKYLAFRHVFRSIYTPELRWESMADLVHELDETGARFESEIRSFIKVVNPK